MADAKSPGSALYLRENEIRRGMELLYFAHTRFVQRADERLAAEGLGRAHHRVLYFIARQPGLTVGALLQLLGVTKQSLGRVINDLNARALIESRPGLRDRRHRLLHLTEAGAALEASLFDEQRNSMAAAYSEVGPAAVSGFWATLEALLPPTAKSDAARLRSGGE